MGQRIWVDISEDEFAILSEVAKGLEGDVRSLIVESALAVARGELSEEAMAELGDRVQSRCERRHCRSHGSVPIDAVQRQALLDLVGAEPVVAMNGCPPRQPPEPPPLCEDVARGLRELLKRSMQQAEAIRRDLVGDVLARGRSEVECREI